MKTILPILCLLLWSCEIPPTFEVLDYKGLKPYLNKKSDKVQVINFWATWCAPCIKELPYFEMINSKYDKVEVLLVSLDFPNQYDTALLPFLKKHKIKSKVIALDDINQNYWIQDIDSTWTGAIPATIIYHKNIRKFYEKSFTQNALEKEVQSFLKNNNHD